MKKTIPIFFACDDAFVKFTVVALQSIKDNASRDFNYKVHVLHTGITERMMKETFLLEDDNFKIDFEDVSGYLASIGDRLPVRDYYSKTTYFRLFIPEMFPSYDKAIYIDSDTVVQGDMSKLYEIDLGDRYVGACHEQAMVQVDEFGTYAERVVGVDRNNFFNAGMLLINCDAWRKYRVLDKFIDYLGIYNFVVTQDEDYLNLICKDHVLWLDQRWNTEVFGEIPYPIEEAYVIHYIMTSKPWHYPDCRYGEIFWQYAKRTAFYDEICAMLTAYTDELRERDRISGERLVALAVKETEREDNFLNIMREIRPSDRREVLERIEEYEKEGLFDRDVECDPEGEVLTEDKIDYLRRGLFGKIKTKIAYSLARRFMNGLIKDKKMIIKGIEGIENLECLTTGAVLTCNHFNAYDSFAMQMLYESANQKSRRFWRVIREGNYTAFPGFYGFLMRNCLTLPLSSSTRTMGKFTSAVRTILKGGDFVLFYPEQSMWWNYRKPKPLKEGAYYFAARCDVPVVPCFITMQDSDIVDEGGFFVQEYTIHVGAPIYPSADLSHTENARAMMEENARVWREIYETTYSMPLRYTTKEA